MNPHFQQTPNYPYPQQIYPSQPGYGHQGQQSYSQQHNMGYPNYNNQLPVGVPGYMNPINGYGGGNMGIPAGVASVPPQIQFPNGSHQVKSNSSINIPSSASSVRGDYWISSNHDRTLLDSWFDALVDSHGGDFIGGLDAVGFLQHSNLHKDTLRKIWALVDVEGCGYVNRQQFYIIMRLISIACSPIYAGSAPSMERYQSTLKTTLPIPEMIPASTIVEKKRNKSSASTIVPATAGNNINHPTGAPLQAHQQLPNMAYQYPQAYGSSLPVSGMTGFPQSTPQFSQVPMMPMQPPYQQAIAGPYASVAGAMGLVLQSNPSVVNQQLQLQHQQAMSQYATAPMTAQSSSGGNTFAPPVNATNVVKETFIRAPATPLQDDEFTDFESAPTGPQPPASMTGPDPAQALSSGPMGTATSIGDSTGNMIDFGDDLLMGMDPTPVPQSSLLGGSASGSDDILLFDMGDNTSPGDANGLSSPADSTAVEITAPQVQNPSSNTAGEKGVSSKQKTGKDGLQALLQSLADDPLASHTNKPTLQQLSNISSPLRLNAAQGGAGAGGAGLGTGLSLPGPELKFGMDTKLLQVPLAPALPLDLGQSSSFHSGGQRSVGTGLSANMSVLDDLVENDLQAQQVEWDDFAGPSDGSSAVPDFDTIHTDALPAPSLPLPAVDFMTAQSWMPSEVSLPTSGMDSLHISDFVNPFDAFEAQAQPESGTIKGSFSLDATPNNEFGVDDFGSFGGAVTDAISPTTGTRNEISDLDFGDFALSDALDTPPAFSDSTAESFTSFPAPPIPDAKPSYPAPPIPSTPPPLPSMPPPPLPSMPPPDSFPHDEPPTLPPPIPAFDPVDASYEAKSADSVFVSASQVKPQNDEEFGDFDFVEAQPGLSAARDGVPAATFTFSAFDELGEVTNAAPEVAAASFAMSGGVYGSADPFSDVSADPSPGFGVGDSDINFPSIQEPISPSLNPPFDTKTQDDFDFGDFNAAFEENTPATEKGDALGEFGDFSATTSSQSAPSLPPPAAPSGSPDVFSGSPEVTTDVAFGRVPSVMRAMSDDDPFSFLDEDTPPPPPVPPPHSSFTGAFLSSQMSSDPLGFDDDFLSLSPPPIPPVSAVSGTDAIVLSSGTERAMLYDELQALGITLCEAQCYATAHACFRQASLKQQLQDLQERKEKAMAGGDVGTALKIREEIAQATERLAPLSEEARWLDVAKSGKRGESIPSLLARIVSIDAKCGERCWRMYGEAASESGEATWEERSKAALCVYRSLRLIQATHSTHRQRPRHWAQMLQRVCYVLEIGMDRFIAFQQLSPADKEMALQEGRMGIFMRGIVRFLEVGLWVTATVLESASDEADEPTAKFRTLYEIFLKSKDEWGLTFEYPLPTMEDLSIQAAEIGGGGGELGGNQSVTYCNLTLRPVATSSGFGGREKRVSGAAYTDYLGVQYMQAAISLWVHDISDAPPPCDGIF